ncbi:hypothetical protein GGI35DRAFT_357182 [Trichoderma velutinum]
MACNDDADLQSTICSQRLDSVRNLLRAPTTQRRWVRNVGFSFPNKEECEKQDVTAYVTFSLMDRFGRLLGRRTVNDTYAGLGSSCWMAPCSRPDWHTAQSPNTSHTPVTKDGISLRGMRLACGGCPNPSSLYSVEPRQSQLIGEIHRTKCGATWQLNSEQAYLVVYSTESKSPRKLLSFLAFPRWFLCSLFRSGVCFFVALAF